MSKEDKYILCPNDCYYGSFAPAPEDRRLYSKEELLSRFKDVKDNYDFSDCRISIETNKEKELFEDELGNIRSKDENDYNNGWKNMEYIAYKIKY